MAVPGPAWRCFALAPVVLACLGSCSHPTPPASRGASDPVVLSAFEVVLTGPPAPAFVRYCRAAGIDIPPSSNGVTRIGPFLSMAEAAWVAWMTTGARVEESEPGFVPDTPAPDAKAFMRLLPPDDALQVFGDPDSGDPSSGVAIAATSVRRLGDGEVRRVRWRQHFTDRGRPVEAERTIDYWCREDRCIHVADHPLFDDPYQESFGEAVLMTDSGPVFLLVGWAGRGMGTKEEELCAFRPGGSARCLPWFAVRPGLDGSGWLEVGHPSLEVREDLTAHRTILTGRIRIEAPVYAWGQRNAAEPRRSWRAERDHDTSWPSEPFEIDSVRLETESIASLP